MSSEDNKAQGDWQRISDLERQHAAITTDIRGIYAGLDEIRDVLVRIQENAKPNLNALFFTILATCTFLMTIGGLTLAPAYRELGRHDDELTRIQHLAGNQYELLGRLAADSKYFTKGLERAESLSLERHSYRDRRVAELLQEIQDLRDEVHYNRNTGSDLLERASRVEGYLSRGLVPTG